MLRPFDDQPLLIGRLVDGAGAPHATQPFRLLLDGEEHGGLRGTTCGEGRFAVLLQREWARRTLRLIEVRGGDRPWASPLACRHDVGLTLHGGANDVGDVMLVDAPLLVAGKLG